MSEFPTVIEKEHLPICKLGQGADCCRYLVFITGFACAKKKSDLRLSIDARVVTMTAQGDNCEGKSDA